MRERDRERDRGRERGRQRQRERQRDRQTERESDRDRQCCRVSIWSNAFTLVVKKERGKGRKRNIRRRKGAKDSE